MNLKKELVKVPLINSARLSYNRYWNTNHRKSMVAMMHIGRVGSTVLGSMMNQHSKIFWDGEPFERLMRSNKSNQERFVENVLNKSMHNSRSEIYCFATKFMPEQHLWEECINMNLEEYISLLNDMKIKDFILITRKNYLRQVISVLVGRMKKEWHSQKNTKKVTKVFINVDSYDAGYDLSLPLIDYFKRIDRQYDLLNEIVGSDKILKLAYEDDIEKDPHIAYNKVCSFLNVKNEKPQIKLKKTNPFDLKDMIENYEEVEKTIKGTKYEWMLTD